MEGGPKGRMEGRTGGGTEGWPRGTTSEAGQPGVARPLGQVCEPLGDVAHPKVSELAECAEPVMAGTGAPDAPGVTWPTTCLPGTMWAITSITQTPTTLRLGDDRVQPGQPLFFFFSYDPKLFYGHPLFSKQSLLTGTGPITKKCEHENTAGKIAPRPSPPLGPPMSSYTGGFQFLSPPSTRASFGVSPRSHGVPRAFGQVSINLIFRAPVFSKVGNTAHVIVKEN